MFYHVHHVLIYQALPPCSYPMCSLQWARYVELMFLVFVCFVFCVCLFCFLPLFCFGFLGVGVGEDSYFRYFVIILFQFHIRLAYSLRINFIFNHKAIHFYKSIEHSTTLFITLAQNHVLSKTCHAFFQFLFNKTGDRFLVKKGSCEDEDSIRIFPLL